MMCIADVSRVKSLSKVKDALEEHGAKSGLNINFQLEDAFTAMHVL